MIFSIRLFQSTVLQIGLSLPNRFRTAMANNAMSDDETNLRLI
jgi:hypothetical protein